MWVRALLILGLVSGAVVARESAHDESCPEIIWSDGRLTRSGPLWVTAEKAVGPDGKINWDFLGESAQQRFETVLLREKNAMEHRKTTEEQPITSAGENCLNYADSILPMGPRALGNLTAEKLVRESAVIFHGRIVAVDHGFFIGRPGSLLKIETLEQIKMNPRLNPFPFVYVYFFNGAFDVGDLSYCNRHSLFPYTPKVGDSMTVLSAYGGHGKDGRIFAANGFVVFPENERALPIPILEKLLKPKKASAPYEVDQILLQVLSSPDDSREDRGPASQG